MEKRMELVKLWHPKSKGTTPLKVPPGDVERKIKEGWTTEEPNREEVKANPPSIPPHEGREETPTTKVYTREDLKIMTMKELRAIGKPLNVNDTDKKELIEEILQAQEQRAS